MAEPVDVLLNLARIAPEELVALAALVQPGGVVVNNGADDPAPGDEERGVRAVGVFVRSDAEQLSRLVALVDSGELRVDVAERACRSAGRWPHVHAQGDAGELSPARSSSSLPGQPGS